MSIKRSLVYRELRGKSFVDLPFVSLSVSSISTYTLPGSTKENEVRSDPILLIPAMIFSC